MAWINFNNGDTGLSIRNALNAFLTTVDTFLTGNNQYTDAEKLKVTTNVTDIATLKNPDSTLYNPIPSLTTYLEGRIYYDGTGGTLKDQGPIDGVEVAVGHSTHIHVINNTGATIEKGMACRHDGAAGGVVQVAKALADTFENARIFGVAQEEILDGAGGGLIILGEIDNFNTLGYPAGVPLYLSDTVAGTYSEVPPTIISQVGGSIVQDGTVGTLVVSVINNVNLPTVLGGIQGQSPGTDTYTVGAISQDITNYVSAEEAVMTTNLLLGTVILSNNGKYRVSYGSSLTFASAITTRTLYIEIYNETLSTVDFTYAKNIPRDATADSLHFGAPFSGIAGHTYKARIRGDVMDVTIVGTSFDIESVSIV